MSKNDIVRLYVHPAFKKKIKMAAVQEDISILEYTRRAAQINQRDNLYEDTKKTAKKMLRFKIG